MFIMIFATMLALVLFGAIYSIQFLLKILLLGNGDFFMFSMFRWVLVDITNGEYGGRSGILAFIIGTIIYLALMYLLLKFNRWVFFGVSVGLGILFNVILIVTGDNVANNNIELVIALALLVLSRLNITMLNKSAEVNSENKISVERE